MSSTSSPTDQESTGSGTGGRRFVRNVVWNWIGTAATLFVGVVLSPIMMRKLGPDGYGVWALSFAMVDYYWFFDFGFRSATVKYVAHYTATEEPEKVGEVLSTSLIYSALVGGGILLSLILSARRIVHFFKVAPGYEGTFATMIILVGVSWCLGLVLGLSGEALEAVQRFDITNRISVFTTVCRAVVFGTLLLLGYGLLPLAAVMVGSQILSYILNFVSFRRVFRHVPISWKLGSRTTLQQLGSFGIHSFMITISTQLQNQAAPLLIGHFLPAAFAGFYNLPMRLIQYTGEFISRIGVVTNSTAAEMSAKSESGRLARLPVYTNRYCLLICAPLAVMFWTYGKPIFEVWAGPLAAPYCAAVLPILMAGNMVGVVGQFSSSMMLLGMGRHQNFARGMVAEMLIGVALLTVIIPRFGIVGAAWVVAIMMTANRGLYLSYLVARTTGLTLSRYLYEVYAGPILVLIPALAIVWLLRMTILPGTGGLQLIAAGIVAVLASYPLGFFTCVEPNHRRLIYGTLSRYWKSSHS